MRFLIGYSSAHGSTAEIAIFLGKYFEQAGHHVRTAPVGDITLMSGYDAILLGSPIHSGVWLESMDRFTHRMAAQLVSQPVFVFMTCIHILEDDGETYVQDHYTRHPFLTNIQPREVKFFAGKLQLDEVNWNERWTLAVRYDGAKSANQHEGDYRDWDAIEAWGTYVLASLGS